VDGSDVAGGPGSPGYHYVGRGQDNDPRDSGQYGVALRWFSPELDTEFGFYTMNYHSRTPILSYVAGRGVYLPGVGNVTGTAVKNPATGELYANYYMDYPEDIRLHGMSFSTTVGTASVQGEL